MKKYKYGIISGFFNPLNGKGHIDYIIGASKICDSLICIVNNDIQVELKMAVPFQTLEDRVAILSSIKYIDMVYRSIDNDYDVSNTIRLIWDHLTFRGLNSDWLKNQIVFINSGDRTKGAQEEEAICERLNIDTMFLNMPKISSSSKLINNAAIQWQKQYEYYDDMHKITELAQSNPEFFDTQIGNIQSDKVLQKLTQLINEWKLNNIKGL